MWWGLFVATINTRLGYRLKVSGMQGIWVWIERQDNGELADKSIISFDQFVMQLMDHVKSIVKLSKIFAFSYGCIITEYDVYVNLQQSYSNNS